MVGFPLAIWYFLRREQVQRQQYEDRITLLYDRLLKREGVAPIVAVEHEKVLKVPDPEAMPLQNPIDEAFYLDDVLEELQHFHNVGHGMTPGTAQALFPAEWARAKAKYDREHAPMKVA